MLTERLLREYVRMLCEDEGYGDLASFDVGSNPYGVHFGSGDELYNVFVKPFADVVGVAAGKTKEASQKALTLGKVAFEAVATTLVPVLRDSYSEIFAKEKEEVEKIKGEYSDVYQRTWDAFKTNDAVCVAFMYSPTAFLTEKFAEKSPKVAARLLSVLTGGELDGWLKKVAHRFGWDSKGGGGSSTPHHHENVPGTPMEGVLREDEGQQPSVGAVLSNKKVRAKLEGSDVVRRLEQDGKQVVRATLKKVYEQAAAVAHAKDLNDLQRKTGAKLKLDKLQQVPQGERQKAEQALLAGVKKAMSAFYVQNLQGQVDAAKKAGVPDAHPYVKDYESVINHIKQL